MTTDVDDAAAVLNLDDTDNDKNIENETMDISDNNENETMHTNDAHVDDTTTNDSVSSEGAESIVHGAVETTLSNLNESTSSSSMSLRRSKRLCKHDDAHPTLDTPHVAMECRRPAAATPGKPGF